MGEHPEQSDLHVGVIKPQRGRGGEIHLRCFGLERWFAESCLVPSLLEAAAIQLGLSGLE